MVSKKTTSETNENINEEVKTEEVTEETENSEVEIKETVEKEKYDDLYDKHLRLMAEFDNFKKRTQKEKEELGAFATAETVEKLLPVIDNLERAISSIEEKTTFSDGIEMVYKQLIEILGKIGVEEIESVGKEFDPNMHNAVMHIEDEEAGANIIVEEFMKGYKFKDKVIRYSMVKVAN